MTVPDAAERGPRLVQQRLGHLPLPSTTNYTTIALKSQIESLELVLSAKETELNLLRQQLIESNELLKSAQKLISEREETTEETCSLMESVLRCPSSRQRMIFTHLEKILQVTNIDQLAKAVEKLSEAESKYADVVKALCVRDRVDITKVSHEEIVRSLRTGEPLKPAWTGEQIHSRKGVAWTFH